MNTSDLTLQMAYLAGQIAQSTLPDIGVSAGRPEQKMDFQALLNEKRTQADRERTEQEPQKTDPSQDTETGKTEQKDEDVAAQAAGQGVPLMLDLSAVLAGGGIVPFVGCAVVTEQAEQITAQAPALPAADAVVEGEKAAEPALPRILSVLVKRLCRKKRNRRPHLGPLSLLLDRWRVKDKERSSRSRRKASTWSSLRGSRSRVESSRAQTRRWMWRSHSSRPEAIRSCSRGRRPLP